MILDATKIWGGLHQGSAPDRHVPLRPAGFAAVVLCAEEYQPTRTSFDVQVYYCPLDDTEDRPLSRSEQHRIRRLSKLLAMHLHRRNNILITCAMGLNRSGIVSAATLVRMGFYPVDAIALIKRKRQGALGNRVFVKHLLAGHL